MDAPDDDGWATTTIPIESVKHAAHQLMQLGADVEVLEPAELRDTISRAARDMTRRYCGESGGTSARGDGLSSSARDF
jgi:predicted DNA-binding transcriptional regulator YafY